MIKTEDLKIEKPQLKRNRRKPARLIEIDSSCDEDEETLELFWIDNLGTPVPLSCG